VKRTLWYKRVLVSSGVKDDGIAAVPVRDDADANLVSSLTEDGLHAPAFDIDYDAELIASSTPGHFHLYLNKQIRWDDYVRVLEAMEKAGLIQSGWAQSGRTRGMTFLRKPGISKGDDRPQSERGPKAFDPDEIPF
jgi:hypothetical protein